MSSTIKLSNGARTALKLALRGKGITGLDTMTKDNLIAMAEGYGIDVNAIAGATYAPGIDSAPAASEAAEAFVPLAQLQADPSFVVTDCEVIPRDPFGQAAAPGTTDEYGQLMEMWTNLDPQGFKAGIANLVARANRVPETVYQEVIKEVEVIREVFVGQPKADASGHIAKRVGETTTAELFGTRGKLGRIKMAIWDCPHSPAIDPDYIWPAEAAEIAAQSFKHRNPVMLWGPAGTGKTSFFQQLAAHLKRPFIRVSCHSQTDAATLVGMRAPKEGGGTEWKDGQLVAAMRTPGAIILLDEPTLARPGVLYVAQPIMDSRMVWIDETGELVHAADGTLFFMADNTNGSGDPTGQFGACNEFTEAQRDRPGITVECSYLPKAKEANVLKNKVGCTPQLATLLVEYAGATRAKARAGDLPCGISLRRLMALAQQLDDGVSVSRAFDGAVFDRQSPEKAEVLRQLMATHCSVAAVEAALEGKTLEGASPDLAAPVTGFDPVE